MLYPGVSISEINNINGSEYINIPEKIDGENVTSIISLWRMGYYTGDLKKSLIKNDNNIRGIKIPNTVSWIYSGSIDGNRDFNDEMTYYYATRALVDNCKNIESIIFTENSELLYGNNENKYEWFETGEKIPIDLHNYEDNLYYTNFGTQNRAIDMCYYCVWGSKKYVNYDAAGEKLNLFVIKDKENGFIREGESDFGENPFKGAYTYLERGAGNFDEDDFDVVFEFVEGEDTIRILKIKDKLCTLNFRDGTIYIDGKDYNVIFSEEADLLKPCVVSVPLSDSQIKLYWENVPFAKGYQIYKYYPSTNTVVKSKYVEKTSTRFSGLKSDTTYYYIVQAIGENNTSGEPVKDQVIPVTTTVNSDVMLFDNLSISWRKRETSNSKYRGTTHGQTRDNIKFKYYVPVTNTKTYNYCYKISSDNKVIKRLRFFKLKGSLYKSVNHPEQRYYFEFQLTPSLKRPGLNKVAGYLIDNAKGHSEGTEYTGGSLLNYRYTDGYQ